ncbi:cellulose synthase operon protein YhjU [Frateuria aurantia DSM 6220]|uniref:Cellulose synthase operon protein YhjU n=2 Tax=Frateuria aurantia TaxID=81475 RepID=H8L5Y4_FRAAD|nr:cellulose synthase operon protein YhjU [Frateuria aurantia DSM 6220]
MTPAAPSMQRVQGLGIWNIYFCIVLMLDWQGRILLQPVANALLAAALLVPLASIRARRLRQCVAIPAGTALLYHETWLPPISRLRDESSVFHFSADYLADIALRFVNWQLLAAMALIALGYMLLKPWLRITTVSLAGLAWLLCLQIPPPSWVRATSDRGETRIGTGSNTPASHPEDLNAKLQQFYEKESQRVTRFPAAAATAQPFDVLIVNICSMAWDDLDAVGLQNHPLFKKMDVVFDNFNSATSYSGPAAIRILRASCGQTSHQTLYQDAPSGCYLFDNLRKLGFDTELALNHDGHFDGFIDDIHEQGQLKSTPFAINDLPRALVAFDGSPIRDDGQVLGHWWQHRLASPVARTALFYNTITMHDGNREILSNGDSRPAGYAPRASRLLDELSTLVDTIQRSGRKVVLIILPEHGAGLRGDRIQMPGLREIPTPVITHIPAAVKLINMTADTPHQPMQIKSPSSFLAISELLSRLYRQSLILPPNYDLSTLLDQLPETAPVSDSGAATVIQSAGRPWVRMKGETDWTPYPSAAP